MLLKRFKGIIVAQTAIQHNSDEIMSTDTKFRRTKILVDNEIKEVPFITGNSTGGNLRRLAFKHLICFLAGIEEEKTDDLFKLIEDLKISNFVYYTLFAGGN